MTVNACPNQNSCRWDVSCQPTPEKDSTKKNGDVWGMEKGEKSGHIALIYNTVICNIHKYVMFGPLKARAGL